MLAAGVRQAMLVALWMLFGSCQQSWTSQRLGPEFMYLETYDRNHVLPVETVKGDLGSYLQYLQTDMSTVLQAMQLQLLSDMLEMHEMPGDEGNYLLEVRHLRHAWHGNHGC